jgi:hypothetical protein
VRRAHSMLPVNGRASDLSVVKATLVLVHHHRDHSHCRHDGRLGRRPCNTVNAEPHGTRASTYMRTSVGAFEENQQRHLSPATSRRLEHRRTHEQRQRARTALLLLLPYALYAACASPPALLCPQHFSAHSPASLHTAALLCTAPHTARFSAPPRFSAHSRTQRASPIAILWHPYCSLHAYRAGCSAVDEQRAVLISARSYPRTRSRVRPTGGGRPRHSHSGTLNGRTVTLNGSTQLPRNRKR